MIIKSKINKNVDRSSFFYKRPELPPLHKREDKYGKILYKSVKLCKLFDKLGI